MAVTIQTLGLQSRALVLKGFGEIWGRIGCLNVSGRATRLKPKDLPPKLVIAVP